MNLIDHLVHEHREAEALMEAIDKSDPGDHRNQLVGELTDALHQHMAVEEEFLYPIVTDVLGKEPTTEALNEHKLAREGLVNLADLQAEPGFGAALDMLKAGIAHHVEEEETDIFPDLRRLASERIEALEPEELELIVSNTREELLAQGKEADVPGRSTMDKDQLAAALVNAD